MGHHSTILVTIKVYKDADLGVGLGKPGFTQLQLFWVPAHQDFGDWVQGALDLGNSGVTQVFGVYLGQI
jgi:hypothetical protein